MRVFLGTSLHFFQFFWIPACISCVSYPSSGIWVQYPRQTVYRVEPDHPEAGVSLPLAPEGYSHHTHQFSSQETNAHPSSWCLHVLHHRQVIGKFLTTTTCAHTDFSVLRNFQVLNQHVQRVKRRENQNKTSWSIIWRRGTFVLPVSSFSFPGPWGSQGMGRPLCPGFWWFDYFSALPLNT